MDPITHFLDLTEDWRYYIRRDGVIRTLPFLGGEIARLSFNHLSYLLVMRSLEEPLPDVQPSIASEIRPFTPADLAIVSAMTRPSEAKLFARRLAKGHVGLLALHAGRPIGYAWGTAKLDLEVEKIPLHLEPGDVLCSDMYTMPEYRGKGVQTALTLARLQLFRTLGYRRAICYIAVGNSPSLHVWQRKIGCSTVGQIDFLRVGCWSRVRLYGSTEFHLMGASKA